MISDWLIIATTIAVLWGLWLLLQFVFDSIENYHHQRGNIDAAERDQIRRDLEEQRQRESARREERQREAAKATKGSGSSF